MQQMEDKIIAKLMSKKMLSQNVNIKVMKKEKAKTLIWLQHKTVVIIACCCQSDVWLECCEFLCKHVTDWMAGALS